MGCKEEPKPSWRQSGGGGGGGGGRGGGGGDAQPHLGEQLVFRSIPGGLLLPGQPLPLRLLPPLPALLLRLALPGGRRRITCR